MDTIYKRFKDLQELFKEYSEFTAFLIEFLEEKDLLEDFEVYLHKREAEN